MPCLQALPPEEQEPVLRHPQRAPRRLAGTSLRSVGVRFPKPCSFLLVDCLALGSFLTAQDENWSADPRRILLGLASRSSSRLQFYPSDSFPLADVSNSRPLVRLSDSLDFSLANKLVGVKTFGYKKQKLT